MAQQSNIIRFGDEKRTLAIGVLLSLGFLSSAIHAQDIKAILNQSSSVGTCNKNNGGSDCCGSPGENECDYVVNWNKPLGPGCADPDDNILRDGVCNLSTPNPQLPTLLPVGTGTDFTFYQVSDLHEERGGFGLAAQIVFPTLLNVFATAQTRWTQNVGIPAGSAIGPPAAVIVTGDISTEAYASNLGQYRLLWEQGVTDSAINYPVYPGLGNHDIDHNDGADYYSYIGTRMSAFNLDRSSTGRLGIDDGGGTFNYSWDWQGVHFVQLHTWAGESRSVPLLGLGSDGVQWLKNDLAANVGNTQKPVVIFQHYGLESVGVTAPGTADGLPLTDADTNSSWSTWWTVDDYNNFWNVIRDYNVIGMFSGHKHNFGVWRPEARGAYLQGDCIPGLVPSETYNGLCVLPTTDSKGNFKSYDDFMNSHGGGCIYPGCSFFEDSQLNFTAVHITDNYMDVAPFSWTNGDFNSKGFAPTPAHMNLYGDDTACRLRINSRFVPIDSNEVTATSINDCSGSCSLSAKFANVAGVNISGPLAVRITGPAGLDVTDRDFVDSCSRFHGNAYKLLGTEFPAGSTLPFSVNVKNAISSQQGAQLYRVLPISAPDPVDISPSSISALGQSPQPVVIRYFVPNRSPITVSVSYNGSENWLDTTDNGYGTDTTGSITVNFNSSVLSTMQAALLSATITMKAQSGAVVTLPVTLQLQLPVSVLPNPINLNSSPTSTVNAIVNGLGHTNVNFEAAVVGPLTATPTFATTPAKVQLGILPESTPGSYNSSLRIKYPPECEVDVPVTFDVQQVRLSTNPPDLPITIDGETVDSATIHNWPSGSHHTIAVPSTIETSIVGQQLRFQSWTNNGTASQTLVVPPYSQAPLVLTATFLPWNALTLNSPQNGTLKANPTSPDNYYAKGSTVAVQATPTNGAVFKGFTGDLSGMQSPAYITMNQPHIVAAEFVQSSAGATVIDTVPSGKRITVDSASYISPQTFRFASGTNHVVTIPTQATAHGLRYRFSRWTDGNASSSRSLQGINSGRQNFIADMSPQYLVEVTDSPSAAGTVAGSGWVDPGVVVDLVARSAPGFAFVNFTGDAAGNQGVRVLVDKPLDVTANFKAEESPRVFASPGPHSFPNAAEPDQVLLTVSLLNIGPGPAGDVTITSIDGFQSSAGGGANGFGVISVLPAKLSTLRPLQRATTQVLLSWPVSATSARMVVHFSANKGTYTGSNVLNIVR